MSKYGDAAVRAVKFYAGLVDSPQEAWDRATSDVFGGGSSSQKKGCPRNAFLGLCEEGLVRGFSKGPYTRSRKNKEYALRALALLRNRQNLANDAGELWRGVLNGQEKQHNSQMDVVIALWNNGLLN